MAGLYRESNAAMPLSEAFSNIATAAYNQSRRVRAKPATGISAAWWAVYVVAMKECSMSLFRFKRSDVWYTLLLVGVVAALVSFVAAILALKSLYPGGAWQNWWATIPPDFTTFPLIASLASALLGPALWWRMIIKPGRLSVRRGIAVGALAGIIAHPIVWYAALALAYLTGRPTVATTILVTNPLQDLLSAIVLAIFSVLFVGWLTALIGGVVGGVIALLQSMSGCRERWQAALSA
jgi:hypothetical protein